MPASEALDGLTENQCCKGIRMAYAGQASGMLLMQMLAVSSFGPLFIKSVGGSDAMAMLMASLLGLAGFVQVPVALMVHPARGKAFLLRGWLASAVLAAAAASLPSFMRGGPVLSSLVVVLAACAGFAYYAGATFWFPLLHDIVPPDMRGRFFGRLRAIWNASTFAAVIAAGAFLGERADIWRFQVVILLTAVLAVARNHFVSAIPVRRYPRELQDDFRDWRSHVRAMLRSRSVMIFCSYYMVLGFCSGFLLQPLALYMRELGFSSGANVVVSGFVTAGMVGSLLVTGGIVDRIGTKRVFLAAHLVLCASSFSVVAIGFAERSAALVLLPVVLTIAGATKAAAGLACSATLFHLAPVRGRSLFLSLANILIFAGPAVAPLVTGALVGMAPAGWSARIGPLSIGLFQMLFFAAGCGLIVTISLLHFVREPDADDGG